MYQCPVCAYKGLRYPPSDYTICPSCGTEFGYDDFSRSYEDLRQDWIMRHMPWFSTATPRPANWSPVAQLLAGGFLQVVNKQAGGTSRSETRIGQQSVRLQASVAV